MPYASARILNVSMAPGDEVHVTMEYRLAGVGAGVDTNIEPTDALVGRQDGRPKFTQQGIASERLLCCKAKEVCDVSARDDQRVAFGNGISISYPHRPFVGGDDSRLGQFAKWAVLG
jgi:hypothetical protein